jgi:hypothetical protein
MAKPLLCVFLGVFIVCNAEQGYAQISSTRQPASSNTETLIPSSEFTLITPDSHRKVVLSLEKDFDGTNTNWIICFILYEKQAGTTTFGGPIISLNVPVALTLSADAQKAAQDGLTGPQAAHATGPAADAAKASAKGIGSRLAAVTDIQNSLK